MTILTRTVNNSGNRFRWFSVHSIFISSLWFFFMMTALRNGAISRNVTNPHTALPAQWVPVRLVLASRNGGSTKLNITAMTAAERMLYIRVFSEMLLMSFFQFAAVWDVSGVPTVLCSTRRNHRCGIIFTRRS